MTRTENVFDRIRREKRELRPAILAARADIAQMKEEGALVQPRLEARKRQNPLCKEIT